MAAQPFEATRIVRTPGPAFAASSGSSSGKVSPGAAAYGGVALATGGGASIVVLGASLAVAAAGLLWSVSRK